MGSYGGGYTCVYCDSNATFCYVGNVLPHATLVQPYTMALNDDLLPTLTSTQVAETRSKIDCPINDPDAILQIMFSGRHIRTIMGHSSLCYLTGGIDLIGGRRLGP